MKSKEIANAVVIYGNKGKLAVLRLTYSINKRWIKVKSRRKYLEDSNKIWLDGLFYLPSENGFKILEDLGIQTPSFGKTRSDFSSKSEKRRV